MFKIGNFSRSEPLIQIASHDFVTIFCCHHHLCESDLILKTITKSSILEGPARQHLDHALGVFQEIDHPFIRQLYGVDGTADHITLYLEKCEGGILSELIESGVTLNDNELHRLFCELVSAVRYLHETKKVCHFNLTFDNIYLDKYQSIQVSGFENACILTEENPVIENITKSFGELQYMAPELIKGKLLGFPIDIWSLGLILYVLVYGIFPFSDPNKSRLCSKILTEDPIISKGSPELQNLLKGLLAKDPLQRFTIQQVATHPWITSSRYGEYTDPSFYLSPKYRVIPIIKEDIDQEIMNELSKHNIDVSLTISDFLKREKTERTMCYELLRKKKVMEILFSSDDIKQRMNLNLKQKKNNKDSSAATSQFRFAKETGTNLAFARTRNRSNSIGFEKSEIRTSHGGLQSARLHIPKPHTSKHSSISESFNPNISENI